jgi:polysaccharide export outer membrane protein
MTRQKITVLAAVLSFASAIGVAQTNRPNNNTPPPPATDKVEAPKPPSSIGPDTTTLPIDPKSYVIGPEDILKITFWREDGLSKAVGVRPDGKISMTFIGDVQAAGLTPERLTAQLKDAYKETVKNPEILVELLQVNSKHYSIAGGVNRPGTYPLVLPTTVFEALNQAGGFKEFANKKDIKILRGTEILHFSWDGYTKGDKKARAQNIPMMPGDTIIVKE